MYNLTAGVLNVSECPGYFYITLGTREKCICSNHTFSWCTSL